jgi:L-alanine-DL-glutamate epimerase-like enolase superfamily enzyme
MIINPSKKAILSPRTTSLRREHHTLKYKTQNGIPTSISGLNGLRFYIFRPAIAIGSHLVHIAEMLVTQAQAMCAEFGFVSIKLKGGTLDPAIEVDSILALREAFGAEIPLRLDPNAVWGVETAIQWGKRWPTCSIIRRSGAGTGGYGPRGQ